MQPVAEMDQTPGDLHEVAEELALDPYWTFEMSPMGGDALLYRPGAVGARDISALRAEAAEDQSQPGSFVASVTASSWLSRKFISEETADGTKQIATNELIVECRESERPST